MTRRHLFLLIFFFVVFWAGFQFALVPGSRDFLSFDYWKNVNSMGKVMRLIRADHVHGERIDFRDLSEPAIREMINSMDEFSGFMSSREFNSFETQARQEYVGIGVEITQNNGRVEITTVFPGSPAEAADLRAGDRFLQIDGEVLERASLSEVVSRVRGRPETRVEITVQRLSGEEFTANVVRRAIEVASIRDVEVREDGIAYLRIQNFGMRTADELRRVLEGFRQQNAHSLIIDLRDNPGGVLQAAVDVTSLFLNAGDLVVSTRGRTRQRERQFFAQGGNLANDMGVVILINRNSASGSEIVAGALRDYQRATLIGETTRGKGSVQTVFSLRGGEGVRLTTAMYYLPGGETIHEVGVSPDIEVTLNEEERLQIFLQRQHRHRFSPERFEEEFGFAFRSDPQLEAAIHHLRPAVALRP